jgi:hypothetical protein
MANRRCIMTVFTLTEIEIDGFHVDRYSVGVFSSLANALSAARVRIHSRDRVMIGYKADGNSTRVYTNVLGREYDIEEVTIDRYTVEC